MGIVNIFKRYVELIINGEKVWGEIVAEYNRDSKIPYGFLLTGILFAAIFSSIGFIFGKGFKYGLINLLFYTCTQLFAILAGLIIIKIKQLSDDGSLSKILLLLIYGFAPLWLFYILSIVPFIILNFVLVISGIVFSYINLNKGMVIVLKVPSSKSGTGVIMLTIIIGLIELFNLISMWIL